MSRLRLYLPPRRTIPVPHEAETSAPAAEPQPQESTEEGPTILSFVEHVGNQLGYSYQRITDPLFRARVIHSNRYCPKCQHPNVEPLELDNAVMSKNYLPIPGTATLVGFHCHGCQHQWPA